MKLHQLSISEPYTHENLSIFLLRGTDTFDGSRFLPLDEALEQNFATVHETGQVGQLEVENLSDSFDLFVQAGDVVKGGRQDRTLGVDFVLPAKSGRVPIPSFCVESGRWHRRGGEAAASFSGSKTCLTGKGLRLAAKMSKSQNLVWDKVAEMQQHLSASLQKSVHSMESPTSYQLSVEDTDLQQRKETFRSALVQILDEKPNANAIGYAFVINGAINTADTYGSGVLFRKLWSKLLDIAILEAIAESHRKPQSQSVPVTPESIRQWFAEAEQAPVFERQEVPPRVRMDTRRGGRTIVFDTCDHGFADAVLHKNLVVQ